MKSELDEICEFDDFFEGAPGGIALNADTYALMLGVNMTFRERVLAASLVRLDALLESLFEGAAYVGIHKNAAGRITLVVNHSDGSGSIRTSCSKKAFSYAEKLIECRNRLSETLTEGEANETL